MGYEVDYKDGTVYGCSDLNALRSAIQTAGVIPETDTSLNVVQGDAPNTVKILQGQAIMSDGAHIEVDSSGVVLTPTVGVTNYVYLRRDLNDISINISTIAPETGDYIILASISAAGVIDNTTRHYSQFKAARGLGNSYYVKKNINLTVPAPIVGNTWYKAHEENVLSPAFKSAMLYGTYDNYHYFGVFDFSEQTIRGATTSQKEITFADNLDAGLTVTAHGGSYRLFKVKLVYTGTAIEFWLLYGETKSFGLNLTTNLEVW